MKKTLLLFSLFLIPYLPYAQCYESLTFGGTHTVGLKSDGTLWGWGQGDWRQLATSNFTEPNPIQVSTLTTWDKAYTGIQNTFAIKSDGTLWGVGSNMYGSLGVGSTTEYYLEFQQITTANNWTKVAPSYLFTLALKADGTLWAWGRDDTNQTGNAPATSEQLVPIQVGTATDWIDIATGTNSTAFALKADGTLWGWGANDGSLLVASSSVYSLSTPTQINPASDWIKMSVGGFHILAQKEDGSLWTWGTGPARGIGEEAPPQGNIPYSISTDVWKSFSTGTNTSFGIKADGTLWAWGLNTNGQLGDGTSTTHYVPTQIGTDTNWDSVHARNFATTMATKTDGSIWYWGTNYYGEFGNGTDYNSVYYTTPQLTPDICVESLSAPAFGKTEISLYPNPASGTVQLQYELGVSDSMMELYDVTGRVLVQQRLDSAKGNETFDISNYSEGIYIVVLKNGNKVLYQQKLIIK
ncbi:T9SS type A sorting domain-containing protein [Flavobacterium soli]|uniref:T9SS type A sorting domain-containing protein n=1 Tax=Flavobacterium soli TaxID=344881 RepID=UPI0004262827|nr:T9SS type A sorting domain-containing protein [Flavobacterium soli]